MAKVKSKKISKKKVALKKKAAAKKEVVEEATESTIKDQLIELTGLTPLNGESNNKFATRCSNWINGTTTYVKHPETEVLMPREQAEAEGVIWDAEAEEQVDNLSDEAFEEMPKELKGWCNEAVVQEKKQSKADEIQYPLIDGEEVEPEEDTDEPEVVEQKEIEKPKKKLKKKVDKVEAEVVKKNAEKKVSKPEKVKKVKKEKKPGVIATIAEVIQGAKKGISLSDIHEALIEAFPEREADSMKKTIMAQVGSKKTPVRMEREKGIKITRKDDLVIVK